MLWTGLTKKALLTAAQMHDGQYRKGGENIFPYVLHPLEVAGTVSRYTDDEEIVAAALLHDTLEDTSYEREALAHDFGDRVARIVTDVSIPEALESKGAWMTSRGRYVESLRKSGSEAALVAAADKAHNFRSIVYDYARDPEASKTHFHGEVSDRMRVYGAIVETLVPKIPDGLADELRAAWKAYTLFLTSV